MRSLMTGQSVKVIATKPEPMWQKERNSSNMLLSGFPTCQPPRTYMHI